MAISLLIAAGTGGRAEVANRPNPEPVRDLLQIYGIDDQSIGYVVYDIAARKRLAARGSDRFFIPASTMKVPTTILALDSLGAEFRFDTAIATTGSVRNGVLHGDLYLRGGGDPQLTHDDFEGFVARLKTLGIAKVAGKFVYDTTLYTGLDVLQPEQPDDAAYNPGIDALSINFNRVKVAWQTPKKPAPMNLTVSSVTDRAPIPIDFVTVAPAPPGTPAKYHFTFVPGKPNDAWLMATQISRQGSAWLPVRRPALHAARVLQLMARQAGIDLPDPKQGATPSDAAIVYRHGSPPLASSVEAMLKYSNNLMAEMVGLAAARKATGQPVALKDSVEFMAKWFATRAPETNWSGMVWDNHSGLSPFARMTPDQMLAVLLIADRSGAKAPRIDSVLRDYRYFPALDREKRPALADWRVAAKTGTMDYARTLAGFITTTDNRRLAFAIFQIDQQGRKVKDGIAERADKVGLARPRAWRDRARGLEQALVRDWMTGRY